LQSKARCRCPLGINRLDLDEGNVREFLIAGLFYGVEGMRIGGKRTLKISPHLAYRDKGIEAVIPPNAVLEIEVKIHKERTEF
jgi:FKBP-type peptidyl-prolyl cis-trans isomerase